MCDMLLMMFVPYIVIIVIKLIAKKMPYSKGAE